MFPVVGITSPNIPESLRLVVFIRPFLQNDMQQFGITTQHTVTYHGVSLKFSVRKNIMKVPDSYMLLITLILFHDSILKDNFDNMALVIEFFIEISSYKKKMLIKARIIRTLYKTHEAKVGP